MTEYASIIGKIRDLTRQAQRLLEARRWRAWRAKLWEIERLVRKVQPDQTRPNE